MFLGISSCLTFLLINENGGECAADPCHPNAVRHLIISFSFTQLLSPPFRVSYLHDVSAPKSEVIQNDDHTFFLLSWWFASWDLSYLLVACTKNANLLQWPKDPFCSGHLVSRHCCPSWIHLTPAPFHALLLEHRLPHLCPQGGIYLPFTAHASPSQPPGGRVPSSVLTWPSVALPPSVYQHVQLHI